MILMKGLLHGNLRPNCLKHPKNSIFALGMTLLEICLCSSGYSLNEIYDWRRMEIEIEGIFGIVDRIPYSAGLRLSLIHI